MGRRTSKLEAIDPAVDVDARRASVYGTIRAEILLFAHQPASETSALCSINRWPSQPCAPTMIERFLPQFDEEAMVAELRRRRHHARESVEIATTLEGET